MTFNPEIDRRSAEQAPASGLSAGYVDLLKSAERAKASDKVAQTGDTINFDNPAIPSKNPLEFLKDPYKKVEVGQLAFLKTADIERATQYRTDGKPYKV